MPHHEAQKSTTVTLVRGLPGRPTSRSEVATSRNSGAGAPAPPLPDASPFVHKLENHLRLAGLAYDKRPGDARKAPRGKLPYIEDEGVLVADTSFIIEHLKQRHGDRLDAALSAAPVAAFQFRVKGLDQHEAARRREDAGRLEARLRHERRDVTGEPGGGEWV